MHGSSIRLVPTKDGLQREIQRTRSGSSSIKCHIFVVVEALLNIQYNELEPIAYWYTEHESQRATSRLMLSLWADEFRQDPVPCKTAVGSVASLTTSCSNPHPSCTTRPTTSLLRRTRALFHCHVRAEQGRKLADNWKILFWRHQRPLHPRRLRRLKRCQRAHEPADQSRLQRQAQRHHFVGADPADHQHCEAFLAKIVFFYTPLTNTTKAIFEDYAGELTKEEYKVLISKIKRLRFATFSRPSSTIMG